MINVSYVDLSKNQLYELSPESLDGIDGVEHLDLMENPWHCNCSIHWMRAVSGWKGQRETKLVIKSSRVRLYHCGLK